MQRKSGLYVARELVPGTPSSSATMAFPCKFTYTPKPQYGYPDEDRNSRDSNWDRIEGTSSVDWTAKGSWYNNECGYLLCGTFGIPSSSSYQGAYQHIFTPLDVPEVLTMWKKLGTDCAIMPLSTNEQLKISWAAEGSKAIEFDTKGSSQKYTRNQTAPTNSFSVGKPYAGWKPVIKIGGVSSSLVQSVEFTYVQEIEYVYGSGSRYYQKVGFGGRKITGKLKADFEVSALLSAFENEAATSLQFTATGRVLGNTYDIFDAQFPVVNFDSLAFDESKPVISIDTDFTLSHDDITNRLAIITLTNSTANYSL